MKQPSQRLTELRRVGECGIAVAEAYSTFAGIIQKRRKLWRPRKLKPTARLLDRAVAAWFDASKRHGFRNARWAMRHGQLFFRKSLKAMAGPAVDREGSRREDLVEVYLLMARAAFPLACLKANEAMWAASKPAARARPTGR